MTTVAALKTLEDTDAGNATEESCVESCELSAVVMAEYAELELLMPRSCVVAVTVYCTVSEVPSERSNTVKDDRARRTAEVTCTLSLLKCPAPLAAPALMAAATAC